MIVETDAVRSTIREYMARSFKGEVNDDDDIFALGFGSSLFAVQLVAYIERQYNIEIEAEDLDMDNFRSINAVVSLIGRKQGE